MIEYVPEGTAISLNAPDEVSAAVLIVSEPATVEMTGFASDGVTVPETDP